MAAKKKKPAPKKPQAAASQPPKGEIPTRNIALGLFALLALTRIAYLWLSKDVASLSVLVPGLDEDIYWRAAKNLHELPNEAINYELLSCSAPWHVYWLYVVQFFSDDIFTVRCLHAAIACGRYMALWWVLGWFFERRLAAAVVVGFTSSIPAGLVFDASLFKTVHDLNFVTAGFAVALWTLKRAPALVPAALGFGLILGLSLLNQLNTLLFFVPVCAFFWFLERPKTERLTAMTIVALMVGTTFLGLKSLQKPWPENKWSLVPHSGFNLYMSLYEKAPVSYKNFPGIKAYPHHHVFGSRLLAALETGGPVDFVKADSYFRSKALGSVIKDPMRFLDLSLRRLFANLNNHEYKGVHYIKHIENRLPLLRIIPAHFGLLVALSPLGLIALWLRRRQSAQAGALFVLTTGYAGVILGTGGLMFVFSRFRLPLYVPLSLLALSLWCTKDNLLRSFKRAKTTLRFAAITTVLAAVILTYWPLETSLTKSWMARASTNERRAEELLAKDLAQSPDPGTPEYAGWLFLRSEYSKAARAFEDLQSLGQLSRKGENLYHILLQLWIGQTGFFEAEFAPFSKEQKSQFLKRLKLGPYESQYLQKFTGSIK